MTLELVPSASGTENSFFSRFLVARARNRIRSFIGSSSSESEETETTDSSTRSTDSPPPPPDPVSFPILCPAAAASAASAFDIDINAMSGAAGGTLFECSVCLEPLDQAASIDVNAGEDADVDVETVENVPGIPVLVDLVDSQPGAPDPNPIMIDGVPIAMPGPSGRARGTARRGRGGRAGTMERVANDNNANLTDIVATFCGHMYHQVCLMKWFREQGKRSCPSCRKSVPTAKVTRLYPGSAENAVARPPIRNPAASAPTANAGDAAGLAAAVPINAGSRICQGECLNEGCLNIKMIRDTLMNDNTELQEKVRDLQATNDTLRDNEVLKDTQIASLADDNQKKATENDQLKRELAVFLGEGSPGPARRSSARVANGIKRPRRYEARTLDA